MLLLLTDLTKKSTPNNVVWTDVCTAAFRELKQRLTCAAVLKSPDFTNEFVLQTDASECGVGAVLNQRDSDGVEHPVGYFSRTLVPQEVHYATIEKSNQSRCTSISSLSVRMSIRCPNGSLVLGVAQLTKGKQCTLDVLEPRFTTVQVHCDTSHWER